jgi:hypothetical protein
MYMNSQQILDQLYAWAQGCNFDAPYGILTGSHCNKRGKKFLSITFGRARTLDATVEIYNRNFLILRTSRAGNQVYRSYSELCNALRDL